MDNQTLNYFRFYNHVLPTIFGFIVGIGFILFGLFVLFFDWKSSIELLCIGGIIITGSYACKSDIPRKYRKDENKVKC